MHTTTRPHDSSDCLAEPAELRSTPVATTAVRDVPGRRRRLVQWCLTIVSLHVLVDSFADTRPGVGATDHLVSGVVPLVALGLVMWGSGRLPRRRSAALTALLGVSVAIGCLAAQASALVQGDVRGATITGASAGAAGVALVVAGLAELVVSRRRDGTRPRRWARRAGAVALGFVSVLFVAAPLGLGYVVANRSDPVGATPWLGGTAIDTILRTADGHGIAASYVPSTNGAAVIVGPGRTGAQVVSRARVLVEHGYGVLVFEPRGHGASEGDPNLLGWDGAADVAAAVDFLQRRPDVAGGRIGGLGLSVGGEMMIEAAAHHAGLRAVVSEGAGTRWVAEDLHSSFPSILIQLPFSTAATVATAVFSDSLPPARLETLVDDVAPRPLLLIWTSRGVGGEWFNPLYFDRAGEGAEIWEIAESAHIDGLRTRPEEYERRVVDFFDRALGVG